MKLAGRAGVSSRMSDDAQTDPSTISLRPRLGETIRQFAARMADVAKREHAAVGATFNGERLAAKPGTTAEDIIRAFWGKRGEDDPSVLTIG